jgi:hypothetical protein
LVIHASSKVVSSKPRPVDEGKTYGNSWAIGIAW